MMLNWISTIFSIFNEFLINLFGNWNIASNVNLGDVIMYSFIVTLVLKFIFNIKVNSSWFSKKD